MEVNPNPVQGADVSESAIQRPGEHLSKTRKAKKLDLNQVAKDLMIPLKTLTALEEDDYQHLPEATFIKGFYRSYANYLNIDVEPIIVAFDQVYTAKTGKEAVKKLTDSPIQMKGKLASPKNPIATDWKKWVGYLVVLVVIIVAIVTIVQKVKSNQKSNAENGSQIEIIDLNGNNHTNSNTVMTTAVGEKLHLEFTRPTSVRIEDAKGKVLAMGRQASTLDIAGEAPFQVRIDDAEAVSLSLNNERIDLSKYMINGKVDFRLAR